MIDWINVTGHAAEQWYEQIDSPGIGPIAAWNRAERRVVSDLDGDEIRYHRATDVLLVRKETALVTVIDVSTARPDLQREIYGEARTPPSA